MTEEGKGEGSGGIVVVVDVNVGLDKSRGGEGRQRTMRRRNGAEERGGGRRGLPSSFATSESYPTYAGIYSKKYTYIGFFHHLLLALWLVFLAGR